MNEHFWQYAVGGLGVAVVGLFTALFNGWFSRADTVDKLQFEQLKFLLEESRTNQESLKAEMAALRAENMKLRDEIHLYKDEIMKLTNEVNELRRGLG